MTYPAEHPEVLVTKTAELILSKYSVEPDRARRLAAAAMDEIDSHGGDPHNWRSIEQVVDVVVRVWITQGLVL
jgi:hypothetical protein